MNITEPLSVLIAAGFIILVAFLWLYVYLDDQIHLWRDISDEGWLAAAESFTEAVEMAEYTEDLIEAISLDFGWVDVSVGGIRVAGTPEGVEAWMLGGAE